MNTSLSQRPPDQLFSFHPRSTNPELWRTTVPLVVRLKCGRHKGLVSTWTAIHWLIVLYAASGRCAFGMREIAEEANVGRNQLAGPRGYIQRLVDLGLLAIVGYEPVPGVKEPRPIYHIDLAELERQSLELTPALLCERHLPPPPRPAPDPRQLALFGADTYEAGTEMPVRSGASPAFGQATHGTGTGALTSRSDPPLLQSTRHEHEPRTHETGTAPGRTPPLPALAGASMHETGTASDHLRPGTRARTHETGTAPGRTPPLPALAGASMHETGTDVHQTEPDHAPDRDVDGSREWNEGGSESTRAHDFHQIVAAAAQATLLVLRQQGLLPAAPAPTVAPAVGLDTIPAAPTGQPPLRASVVELWRGDRQQVSSREATQLTLIADSYDAATGGFGAYWLGRAIILADLCLSEHERPLNLPYVRSMLRRWAEEGSWGSDLPYDEGGGASRRSRVRLPLLPTSHAGPPPRPAMPAASAVAPAEPRTPAATVPVSGGPEHPAIAAYRTAFGRELNPVQAEEIAKTVTDLATWQQVLHDWQLNTWDAERVGNMLDRYGKTAGLPSSAIPSGTATTLEIYQHPDLSDDERQRWLRRVSLAAPADKLQLLLQFRKEHPRA